jgi:Mlc titration factor MtfA (ptsG expression regulator)
MIFKWLRNRRRKKVISSDSPSGLVKTLESWLPLYSRLNKKDRLELIGHVNVLLNEKRFIGAHDLKVTDQMKFLICGQAAMLLLHRKTNYFPNVNNIIIYESAFASMIDEGIGGNTYIKKYQPRVGESNSHTGTIVLSWASALAGASNPSDGQNVVLHEFAHQLDSEDGKTNGAPLLPSNTAYRVWAKEMTKEFYQLQDDLRKDRKTFIDKYGATNPAEFFAVITESFFEKPQGLKKKYPDLYKVLSKFYKQDPTSYFKVE